VISIADMLPGGSDFSVVAKGLRAVVVGDAISVWNHKLISAPEFNWQRNFDSLDFDLSPEMAPVTIALEQAVRIRGRVIDPDGNPVAGATAAPP